MWRERVKRQLQHEKQRWLEARNADTTSGASASNDGNLHIISINKLLQLVSPANTSTSSVALAALGIQCIKLQPPERQQNASLAEYLSHVKRSRGNDDSTGTQDTGAVRQAAYVSDSVWITGFLRFRDAERHYTDSELCLSDASGDLGCHALVLDPKPEYVDRLVLVKKWVLVDSSAGPGSTAEDATIATNQRVRFGDLFLEIHQPPTILQYENEPIDTPSQDAVLRIIDAHYSTQNPPLYIGSRPWRAAVTGQERSGHAVQESDDVTIPKSKPAATPPVKAKPAKKVRAVFGRVACVSPVASQRVRARDHFFAEVEVHCPNHERQQQIIMFTGERNVRWRLFLRPGDQVLVTDLVKVQSQEYGIFMLQTTTAANNLTAEDPAQQHLSTQVFVWHQTQETMAVLGREVGGPQYTEASQESEVLDCEGVLTRVLWNDCLEVQGDNDNFVVCLFHYPGVNLGEIRAGARVRILNAHMLRKSNPIDRRIVIGLCARSHFSVVAHGCALQQCLRLPSSISSKRKHHKKKLSYLGDRSTQPLPVSVWLSEVLEALVAKFSFGRIAAMSTDLSKVLTSFPEIRDREALSIFAEVLNVSVSVTNSSSLSQNSTLSGQFLNSHAPDARNCASVQGGGPDEGRIPQGQIVLIRDLQQWGRTRLAQAYAEKSRSASSTKSASEPFCVQVPAEELNWCLLVGCLSGNVYSGDLEICDRTGSIPLSIDRGSKRGMSWDRENSSHLYVVRRFELFMETYCAPGVAVRDFEKDVVILRISCSLGDMERVPMENATVLPRGEQELTVFVTHIDPVRRASVLPETQRGLRPVYRHVHGIALPTDQSSAEKSFKKTPRRVEILINTSVPHWHVEKYGCYRIIGAICEENPLALASDWSTASAATIEEKAIVLTELFLSKVVPGTNGMQTQCFEELVASVSEFDAPYQSMRSSRLEIFRVEPGSSIEPLRFVAQTSITFTCPDHDICTRPRVTQQGLLDFSQPQPTTSFPELHQACLQSLLLTLEALVVEISPQQLMLLSVLQHFAVRAEKIIQVLDLLRYPLPNATQPQREEFNISGSFPNGMLNGSSMQENDIHRTKLYSIVGVIAEKNIYWGDKPDSPVQGLRAASNSRASTVNSRKRGRENGLQSESQELMCLYKVRDLGSMDTIEVRVNASRFGVQLDLQPQMVVEFSKLQGFVARATYKIYMNWGICSGARVLHGGSKLEVPRDAQLYGAMTRSTLNELYHSRFADRRLRRWVVRVVYVNKVVLKRKCRKCYCGLLLEKRQASWVHQPPTAPSSSTYYKPKPNTCPWYQIQIEDPQFDELTFASLSIRCTIDDGSAQAELHLENDVAWDLLACSKGVRRGFEALVHSQVKELSYPMGQALGTQAPLAFKHDDEHENEFSTMIASAKQSLRSVVVFGHQFYNLNRANNNSSTGNGSNRNEAGEREFESALKFGRDIQITTKRLANVRLEARRVDILVPVKSELRQRLASLRHQ